ncbi:uncharacterized protein Z520_05746 [Fonsecaea multimorphosa CBS 102226]|uniref:GST N-terminal domain-containing protein n=1 Tax=Fonsecaea multimorphosa CBS 102226 TaxID=1442371 RepID=A0A0D2H9C9_9EURO|nr:uncharacterized protein Z520_05746 [Fonsecaea multimorphosa CBS 102226]KIX98445.1 hypothetical protein Z520_05746 [Fonsecaea multimorphosa CBS 102226]
MSCQTRKPDITLFFLGASRAIRIAWLLEELNLPYQLVSSPRAPNGLAPEEFKAQIPTRMGKSPVIKDGDLVVQESAAIAEYLCETYDPQGRLLPKERRARAKVREWMAAAEGTFMIHALAILYARWRLPKPAAQYLPEMEKGLARNVHNALNWLEAELADGRQYLVMSSGSRSDAEAEAEATPGQSDNERNDGRDDVSAADILMGFSVDFIFARKLGTEGADWPNVRRWLHGIKQREAYTRAVKKTGYSL